MKSIKDLTGHLSIFFVTCLMFTATGEAQTPEEYWAMEMGNSWTYHGTNPSCGNCLWTVQTRVALNPDMTVALPGFTTQYVEHFEEHAFGLPGMPLDQKDWYAINATEIRWLKEVSYEPPPLGRWVTLTFDGGLKVGVNPISVGASWSESNIPAVYDGVAMTINSQFNVIGQETITVASGTYNAYLIHSVLTVPAMGGAVRDKTQWFVPSLGFVKELEADPTTPGDVDTFVLTSTNVGTTFLDVPTDHFARPFIEQLSAAGITGGCMSGLRPSYCPEDSITRGQMAVFIEAALGNPTNPCAGRFADVSASNPICGFIERMAADGITSGCGGANFCPDAPVTRGQMAVFIEAALGNPANTCTGRFTDVDSANPFCGFVERLADDGITGGCGGSNFCPHNPVTRAQMAVFLVAAPSLLTP